MPQLINMNRLATNTDFSSISKNSVAEILQSNQTGRLTLDSQGHLTAITPPARRDNWIVRFFKGLFNPAYSEQQKQLDRLPVLEQNAAFSQQILKKIADITHSEDIFELNGAEPHDSPASYLAGTMLEHAPLTLESLRLATSAVAISSSTLTGFQDAHGRAIPIMVGGKPMNMCEFLKQYVSSPAENRPGEVEAGLAGEDNRPNDSIKTLSMVLYNTCLQALKGVNMTNNSLLTVGEQTEMTALLARPASSLQPPDKARLNVLMTRISTNMATRVSEFVNIALKNGADTTAVANRVSQCLSNLARTNDLNPVFTELNPYTLAEQHPAVSQPVVAPQNGSATAIHRTALQAMGNDPIKAARLEMLATGLKLSEAELDLALSLRKDLSMMFGTKRAIFFDSDSDVPSAALQRLSQCMDKAEATGVLKKDRLQQVYEAALFAGMLDGALEKQKPLLSQTIIDACQQLLTNNPNNEYVSGHHDMAHPVSILMNSAAVMRDKIQPLLSTGTSSMPASAEQVSAYSGSIAVLNMHTQLALAATDYLKTINLEVFNLTTSDLPNLERLMLQELNASVRADAEITLTNDELAHYFTRAVEKNKTTMNDVIQDMMNSLTPGSVQLDAFHKSLFNLVNTFLLHEQHSNEAMNASSEIEKALQKLFSALPMDSRKSFYETLMNDPLMSDYIFMVSALFLQSAKVLSVNPQTLLRSRDIKSYLQHDAILRNVMLSLEASLGLQQGGEDKSSPCQERISSSANKEAPTSENIFAVAENFLATYNLQTQGHLR